MDIEKETFGKLLEIFQNRNLSDQFTDTCSLPFLWIIHCKKFLLNLLYVKIFYWWKFLRFNKFHKPKIISHWLFCGQFKHLAYQIYYCTFLNEETKFWNWLSFIVDVSSTLHNIFRKFRDHGEIDAS